MKIKDINLSPFNLQASSIQITLNILLNIKISGEFVQESLSKLLIELCKNPIGVKKGRRVNVEDLDFTSDSNRRGIIITKEFEKAGLDVELQHISDKMIEEFNVIGSMGTRGGTGTRGGEEIILCAHHDRMPGTPGADDNTSGMLTLIGLAHNLGKKYSYLPRAVKLISFAAEERYSPIYRRTGWLGSKYYVEHSDIENVWGVINLDLCGRGDQLSLVQKDARGSIIYDVELGGIIRRIGYRFGLYIDNTFIAGSSSDNRPFAEKGKRTVWLTRIDPKRMRWAIYHSRKDIPETIKLEYIEENRDLLEEVVDYFMKN